MKKDLLSIRELSAKEINDIFALAKDLKKYPKRYGRSLAAKTLALIFEKPSNRTYVSFQVGMYQLGGNSVYLGPEQIRLGVRETVHDVAKTLSRYVDGIVLRTFGHDKVKEMARHACVPVINGLSDLSHPCQALADTFTMQENFGKLKGLTLAYIGDGNNVCHSLLYCCAKLGINMNVATPAGYEPWKEVVNGAKESAAQTKSRLSFFHRPEEAARAADVLYTDVWASMGQEQEAQERRRIFKDFQVNSRLIALAKKRVLIMHCLPAHRGEEISDDAIDGKHSVVFDQAENRMHVQKAVLVKLLK
jgi:ornithine carbamoyltransferase